MSDNVTLPLTGSGDGTALCSTEEVTTLNGGAVSAQHVQRVVPAARTADGVAVDIGHAEDAAHASGHAGIMALAVRKDTAAALAGTDGDYAPLEVDANGRVHIAPAPANDGVDIGNVDVASVVPGTGATNLGKAEDAVHGSGDVGIAVWGVRNDGGAATLTSTDGDYSPIAVDAAGQVRVTGFVSLNDGDGTDIGNVDVASVVPGTGATNLGKAEDAVHGSGDVGVMALAVRKDTPSALSADGDYHAIEVDASGRVWVNVATGNITASLNGGDAEVSSSVIHDAVDSQGPVKIGGQARTTNPTAVADADRVNAIFDDLGRQVVVLNQVRDLAVHQTTTITNSTTETTILTAVASTLLDLVSLDITNASATAVTVTIKDATAGTTRAVYALAANGGIAKTFAVPFNQATANNNWTATLSVNTVTVHFVVQAVKNV